MRETKTTMAWNQIYIWPPSAPPNRTNVCITLSVILLHMYIFELDNSTLTRQQLNSMQVRGNNRISQQRRWHTPHKPCIVQTPTICTKQSYSDLLSVMITAIHAIPEYKKTKLKAWHGNCTHTQTKAYPVSHMMKCCQARHPQVAQNHSTTISHPELDCA